MIDHKDTPVLLLKGGGGSSKSYSASQYIIDYLCMQRSDLKIVVGRKYMPQLRITAMESIINRLEELKKVGWDYYYNSTFNYITFRGNKIYFLHLEDIAKIQSVDSNYVWLEEGTELDAKTFNHMYSRNRLKNKWTNQMILTFNPIDVHSWIKTLIIDPKVIKHALNHSTYLDNPFLNPQAVQVYKDYEKLDPHFYKIYTLGEWGCLENLIYKNWDTVDKFPDVLKDEYYGLDFGFKNASACVRIGEVGEDDVYFQEILYQPGLTTSQIIQKLKHITKVIYPDSAEPDRIAEMEEAGMYVEPAYKGKNSVTAGIDYLRGKRIHITKDSPNLIMEIEKYSHRELRNGVILDEPLKIDDHGMDAGRYGVYTRHRELKPSVTYIDY